MTKVKYSTYVTLPIQKEFRKVAKGKNKSISGSFEEAIELWMKKQKKKG